jgi:hypothetical protein
MDKALLIKYLIILTFVTLPAIGRMLAKMREQRNMAQGPARPKPVPGQPERSEIEEFLRRASRGAAGQSDMERQQPARRPPATTSLSTRAQPLEAQVIDEKSLGGHVGDHVKSYLDSSDFKRRTASLADDMAEADEKRVEHLHEVFGHQVGQLGADATPTIASQESVSAEAPAVAAGPAFDLVGMFGRPDKLRQAILLQEILQRPEHRWS